MSYFGIPLRNGLPIGLGSVAALSTNAIFNPTSLFANGEQGWIYNPSNFSTLFQDSVGTTPVTAVEQPVGLQLDLSQNLTLGPELFSSFTSTGTWTVSGSTYSIVSAAANTDLRVDFVGTTGKRYVISFTATGVSGTVVYFPLHTSPPSVVNGTNITRELSNAGFFIIRANTGGSATISSISVKELPGNHRYQATSANRPVVSARVNLLTKTEDFANAVWTKTGGITVTANATTAPDGTTTADSVITGSSLSTQRIGQIVASSGTCKFSFYAKPNGYEKVGIWDYATTGAYAAFNLTGAGAVLDSGSGASGVAIQFFENGWYLLSFNATGSAATGFGVQILPPSYTTGSVANAWTPNGTSGVFLWGADTRVTNQGVGLPAYQYVNTSTDYTSAGFPIYIKPNGSNQFMQTSSINFTATDKMTVWQGVRKLSDAAVGSLQETFPNFTVAGGYGIYAPPSAATASYAFLMTGATGSQSNSSPTTYASPITNVLFVSMNIGVLGYAGMFAKINAQSIVLTNSGAGVTSIGNFANAPIYFYMRGGSTLPFNGNDYASIARGAASTATQITDGETWVNNLTKAY